MVLSEIEENDDEEANLVVFEFKVTGMTCVACSSTIERHMASEFTAKKMTECTIALLTHKMTVTFKGSAFIDKIVSPEMICDEIDMVGFECSLISITEINQEELKKKKVVVNGPPGGADDDNQSH